MKRRWVFLFVILISFLDAGAQNTFALKVGKEPVRVSGKFLYLEDKTHSLTLEQVLSDKGFKPPEEEAPNYDVTSSAIWGIIKLTTAEEADWYINLEPPTYTNFVLFQKTKEGAWKKSRSGNTVPDKEKDLPVNHIIFKLDLHAGDTVTVLFRIYDYYPVNIDIKAGTLESFVGVFHNADLFNSTCYGVLLMMLLYNLYLFIIQRERIYFYYVLYVFFSLIFSLTTGGNLFHCPRFIQNAVAFAPTLPPAGFGMFILFFTLELFKGLIKPVLKKLIYGIIVLIILNALAGTIDDLKRFSYIFVQVAGIFLAVFSLLCGYSALRKGHSSAVYYLVGFGAYLGTLAYLILAAAGVFPLNISLAFRALLAGSAIEAILLSFALGDKMKYFQKEKEKAQEETLKQVLENTRLVKEQNILLEQKVKERTAELSEKNREILDSIRYASRIQRSLMPTEKYIERILKDL